MAERLPILEDQRSTESDKALLEQEASNLPPLPRTRGDCVNGPRPCLFVRCRYHLFLDVSPKGAISLRFGENANLAEMPATCALDLADQGSASLQEVADVMNVTSQRVLQIEEKGKRNFERKYRKEKLPVEF